MSKYNLPTPITCDFWNMGLNDTYIVKAGSSIYYLRVYRCKWRTKAEIQAELDMLTHLHSRRLPVSWPIERKDGSYLTRMVAPEGVRYAALFTNAPGTPVPRMNVKQSCSYGELVGRIHTCLDKVPDDDRRFHLDFPYLIDGPLLHIAPFLEHRRRDFDYLKNVSDALKLQIDGLLPKTRPEYGSCHGDHHGGDVHTDKNGNMTMFDFDCYGYGWRAYDIAVFLWSRNCASYFFDGWNRSGKAKATRQWNAFLNGYSKIRTLSTYELEAARIFVPIRHIWMIGLATHLAETGARCKIDDGYFDRHIKFIRQWIEYHRIS